ncbi:MAG: hypothetical protein IPO47_18780 [Bacteroidetes bacterium]|nr:hypothetical protein [Bacteroidota bacterium]
MVDLGVNETPVIYQFLIPDEDRHEYKLSYGTRYSRDYERYFDGAEEVIENLTPELSFLLWKFLCKSMKQHNGFWNFKALLKGRHEFFYGTDRVEQFNSAEFIRLTESEWIYTKENSLSVASALTVDDLAEGYEILNTEAKSLMEMLEISNPDAELKLTAEQMAAYEFGKKLLQQGVTQNDLPELLQMLLQKQSGRNTDTSTNENDHEGTAIDKTLKKIREKFKNPDKEENLPEKTSEESEEKDEDEFTKQSVDFEKKISRKEEQLKAEIEQLTRIQELTEAAAKAEKYSFIWFKSLLELEYWNSSESNSKERKFQFNSQELKKKLEQTEHLFYETPTDTFLKVLKILAT